MSLRAPRPPPSRRDLDGHAALVAEVARAVLRRRRLPLDRFLDDAIQDGFVGLSRAFDGYDGEKGASFEAYARPCVKGAIIDALRREHRHARIKKLLEGADAAAGDFAEHHVISDEGLQTPAGAVQATKNGIQGYLAALGLGYLGAIRHLDPETAIAARHEHARALELVQTLLSRLALREQVVLRLRTLEGLPWAEVAARVGKTKATVQRWHAAAMNELKRGLAEQGITERPRLPDAEDEEE